MISKIYDQTLKEEQKFWCQIFHFKLDWFDRCLKLKTDLRIFNT